MKKRMMFAVCMVLLVVFCCLSGGSESSPKDENPSSSNKMDAASDAPEKTVYDEETLLKAFFGVPDTGVSLDDLPDPADMHFLDNSFLGSDADLPEQQLEEASDEISSDELNVIAAKQVNEARSNPDLQRSVGTEAFQADNNWMDTHYVYTYPVPESLSFKETRIYFSDPTATSESLSFRFCYSDQSGRNRMDVHIKMGESSYYTTKDVHGFRQVQQHYVDSLQNLLTDQEIFGEDGLPRRLVSDYDIVINKGTRQISTVYQVTLLYMHDNCTLIQIDYIMESEPGTIYTDFPSDLTPFEVLASGLAYQVPEDRIAAGLPDWLLTEKDFDFHVDTKPATGFLLSRQTVQIIPAYERSDLKKAVKYVEGFSFSAVDTEQLNQGNTVLVDEAIATIDAKGVLKAGSVSEPTAITIVTVSDDTGAFKTVPFILLPAIQKVELSEKKLTLYAGDSAPMKFQGILTPASAWVQPENGDSNLVWSSSKPDILSVTDNRDTTATIEALAPGNATVTLMETTSKKKATASVTILQPVTELSIDGPDTLAPGRGAGYKAVIGPKNAGNKKVQWSIDVDASIATIKSNGQLKIAKGTPSGTVITLTCTAEGAAAPRVATKTVTVE